MSLPQGLNLSQTQNTWATALDPIVNNALVRGQLLANISLTTGVNVINHKLQRKMQGYILTDQNATASIIRTEPFNNLTLTLTCDADVTIGLWVF